MDQNTPQREMPRFISCKPVWALKIANIIDNGDGTADLAFEDAGFAPRRIDMQWVRARGAQPDGYLVHYEGNYQSWSPADAFEAGNTPRESWGIQRPQEPKYGIDLKGRIVNRKSGKPVPDEEPVFILRAKDLNALATLAYYRSLLSPGTDVMASVDERILAFSHFREMNPLVMKHPDSKAPIPPEPTSIAQAPRTPERPRAPWPFPTRT